jgi:hypothetical protein
MAAADGVQVLSAPCEALDTSESWLAVDAVSLRSTCVRNYPRINIPTHIFKN